MSHDKFELVFVGGTKRRYRRWHASFEAAKDTAERVLHDITMAAAGGDVAARNTDLRAVIYGPGCGQYGHTIAG